jgi:hypothetical protein
VIGLIGLFILAACSSNTNTEPVAQAEAATLAEEEDPSEVAQEEDPVEEATGSDENESSAAAENEESDSPPGEANSEEDAVTDDGDEGVAEESGSQPESGSDQETDSEEDAGTEEDTAAEASGESDDILTDDGRSDIMKQITEDWNTNWNRHTVPYDELVPVLFRDGIAAGWLEDDDPVIAVELNGEARAYPLRILSAHEIVNDNFGDLPVVITFCPLCNSAIVFDGRLNGETLEFGTSGWLRNSDLIMYDRTTESLWQQFTGEGIVGDLAGERLTFLPSSVVSFSDFSEAFPEGTVLSIDTGFDFSYNLSSYAGYDTSGEDPFLFFGDIDPRLPTMERVVSITLDNVDVAYPVTLLSELGVINDSQDGQDIVVFHTFGTSSAFFNPVTQDWDDVGATGVFDPNLNGEKLTFAVIDGSIVDNETGSSWNILGQATDGPLAGESLTPIVHGDHFWFSWAAFKPDTVIFEG